MNSPTKPAKAHQPDWFAIVSALSMSVLCLTGRINPYETLICYMLAAGLASPFAHLIVICRYYRDDRRTLAVEIAKLLLLQCFYLLFFAIAASLVTLLLSIKNEDYLSIILESSSLIEFLRALGLGLLFAFLGQLKVPRVDLGDMDGFHSAMNEIYTTHLQVLIFAGTLVGMPMMLIEKVPQILTIAILGVFVWLPHSPLWQLLMDYLDKQTRSARIKARHADRRRRERLAQSRNA